MSSWIYPCSVLFPLGIILVHPAPFTVFPPLTMTFFALRNYAYYMCNVLHLLAMLLHMACYVSTTVA